MGGEFNVELMNIMEHFIIYFKPVIQNNMAVAVVVVVVVVVMMEVMVIAPTACFVPLRHRKH